LRTSGRCRFRIIPDEATFREATIDLSQAATVTSQRLRELVAGRIVVIANMQSGMEAAHRYPDGRVLPGAVLQIAAIHSLIVPGLTVQVSSPKIVLLFVAATCAAAVGLTVWLSGSRAAGRIAGSSRWARNVLPAAAGGFVAAAAAVGAAVALFYGSLTLLNPMPAAVAAVAAALGTAIVLGVLRKAGAT
jgi:hypothetical protein